MPYTCHLCADAETATVLITPLQGGETMAIGPDCMVTGLCGLLSVATQVDAEQLYDAIIRLRADAEHEARLDSLCERCQHPMRAHGMGCRQPDCDCDVAGPARAGTRKRAAGQSRAKAVPVADSEAATA